MNCTIIMLQLQINQNSKDRKVYCVLKFDQSKWLKTYIEFNTQKKRIVAEKKSGKDRQAFFISINNAIYDRTMENMRNGVDVRLVNNEKDYLKWPG